MHNFEQADRPQALRLPPGRGIQLRDAMRRLAEEALAAITASFESEEFRARFEELAITSASASAKRFSSSARRRTGGI